MLNFVQVAWLGLARAQPCTDTVRQLVQQRTCGTRSSSYSTLYRYAAEARPGMYRRDGNTLQQLVQQCTGGTRNFVQVRCSSSSCNAQAGRDILQCGSYSTVVQRQCDHAASNAKREQSPLHPLLHSTTPPTPLPPLLLVVLFTRLVLLY